MKAYYGFKVKGNLARFLEQFKDFQWLPDVYTTGFLGVEIDSSEYAIKKINFPRMLENYLIVAYLSENKTLADTLMSYQKEEKKPVIFTKLEFQNKFYENKFFEEWDDYDQQSQNIKNNKNKP